MRLTLAAVVVASAGFVAAQTSTSSAATSTSTSECAAQNIVDACLASEKPQADACAGNDWVCMCSAYTDVLTCYNNCPSLPEKASVQNQVTQFCNAAAPALSSMSEVAKTAKTSATTTATSSGSGAATSGASNTSGKFDSLSASSTAAAGHVVVPAGGVLAIAFGLARLL